MEISNREFALFRDLVYRETGIHLADHKRLLLITRLTRRLRAFSFTNFSQYYTFLTKDPRGKEELSAMINLVTTNKTSFFREPHHFDFFSKQILARVKSGHQRNLRIWSAGCSTGQEPYTIALEIKRTLGEHPGCDIKILATDIDTDVLNKGRQGIYTTQELEGIPPALLSTYFSPQRENPPRGEEKRSYAARPALRNMIHFNTFNLMTKHFPFKYGFDVIFCRNVLIYFKKEDKTRIIRNFISHLRPEGYLILGHSESLLNQTDDLVLEGPTIYRKTAHV